MKRSFVFIAIAALSTACSPALVIDKEPLVVDQGVVCNREIPTGSHRAKTVCTTAAEREEERKEGQAMAEREQQRQRAQDQINRAPVTGR